MIDTLLEFCRKHKKLYCYGAGRFGREVCIFLSENGIKIAGFWVSAMDPDVKNVLGLPVYKFGTVDVTNDTGIILAVGHRFKKEMESRLIDAGVDSFYYVDEKIIDELEKKTSFVQNFSNNQLVNVLLYHRVCSIENDIWGLCVSPKHFEEQIRYIKKNYKIIRFDDDWSMVSEPSVVITFDDGYRDNYLNAFPVLKKYDVPAMFFVSTGNIGKNAGFWWDRLSKISDIDIAMNHSMLRKMSSCDRDVKLEILEKENGRTTYSDDEEDKIGYTMSESELKGLASSELVGIGVHTVSHTSLSSVSSDIQMMEIKESKERLEELLGKTMKCFSYPYGDYNGDTIGILKEFGFEKAATVSGGLAGSGDLMRIPRNVVRDSEFDDFKRWFISLWCIFAEERKGND